MSSGSACTSASLEPSCVTCASHTHRTPGMHRPVPVPSPPGTCCAPWASRRTWPTPRSASASVPAHAHADAHAPQWHGVRLCAYSIPVTWPGRFTTEAEVDRTVHLCVKYTPPTREEKTRSDTM